jgi:DNA-binding NarL/FixJ family response regulator
MTVVIDKQNRGVVHSFTASLVSGDSATFFPGEAARDAVVMSDIYVTGDLQSKRIAGSSGGISAGSLAGSRGTMVGYCPTSMGGYIEGFGLQRSYPSGNLASSFRQTQRDKSHPSSDVSPVVVPLKKDSPVMSVSVVIADDHAVVREGIAVLLAGSDVQVVGQAASAKEAIETTLRLDPDVVLLDVRMGANGGLEALEKLRAAKVRARILMLSTFDNPTYVARAIALGADDYVLKDLSREQLLAAIKQSYEQRPPAPEGVFSRIQALMSKQSSTEDQQLPLTSREAQVLRHIALGLSNREIGLSLSISVETVKEHVQNILRKIDASDRTQAAVWAVRNQLV